MPSVADLVDPAALETLTTPATLRLGREIVEQGGVDVIAFGPLKVRAHVGKVPSSETRRPPSCGSMARRWVASDWDGSVHVWPRSHKRSACERSPGAKT